MNSEQSIAERLISEILGESLDESCAYIYNYYAGTAPGVLSWRSSQVSDMRDYVGRDYPRNELDLLFGSELANQIRELENSETRK